MHNKINENHEHRLLSEFVKELKRKINPGFIILYIIDNEAYEDMLIPVATQGQV